MKTIVRLARPKPRLEIVDHEGLAGESIYFAIGNGSIATLSVGTASTNWRADFDKVSTAQNLADLINKEDRVSKAAVEFSPTFTLEGSTSNIAVHNEVLASANADYGNGKLKLTSMRQTKGGEALQIASTDLSNLTISQNASRSTKTANAYFISGLTAVSNPLVVSSYPAPDNTLTINGYLSGFTYIQLQSGANDPSTVFNVGDKVFTPDGDLMGVISLFGGGAGAYTIFFEEAIPSGSRPALGTVIHDFKKVNLAALSAPIANGGYLASGDSSLIFNSASETYGTVTAAADGGSPSLTFSSPVTKLDAGTQLFNRKYFRTTGTGTHTFTSGEEIFNSAGTKSGYIFSLRRDKHTPVRYFRLHRGPLLRRGKGHRRFYRSQCSVYKRLPVQRVTDDCQWRFPLACFPTAAKLTHPSQVLLPSVGAQPCHK